MRQRMQVGELGHPKLESWLPWSRQRLRDSATHALSTYGDEQIRMDCGNLSEEFQG